MSNYDYSMNNKYPNHPPIMHDTRSLIASYQPQSHLENKYVMEANTTSNMEYRKYLTDNAKTILQHNMRQSCNDVGYYLPFNEHMKYLANSEKADIFIPDEKTAFKTNYSFVANDTSLSDLKKNYLQEFQKSALFYIKK